MVIRSGPFSGCEGIFDKRLDGNERVQVLLNLLQNRQMRLVLPVRQVQLQNKR